MNDTYFLDRDGSPLGGKVPLQVFFHGDPTSIAKIRSAANQALNAFLANIRNSVIDVLSSTKTIPGGEIAMSHIHGVTRVHVYAQSAELPGTDKFYGGILIRPRILSNEDAYLLDGATPNWIKLDIIETSGQTGDRPGRPGVPGAREGFTDWLVVHIDPTADLSSDAIASGAVRIRRIEAPKFGEIAEVCGPGEYAVSTRDPGAEFYVCGKKMEYVRAFPAALPIIGQIEGRTVFTNERNFAAGYPEQTRLYTFRKSIPSFSAAAKTEAIIILAVNNKLYLFNTKERVVDNTGAVTSLANWRLLHTGDTPPARPMPFGSEFSRTTVGAVTTIVCSGSTPLKACSGFTVIVTDTPAGPTFAGFLNLVDTGYVEAGQPTRSEAESGSYQMLPQAVHVDAFPHWYPRVDYDPSLGPGTESDFVEHVVYDRHVAYQALGFYASQTASIHQTSGTPGVEFDIFRGGAIPQPPMLESHYEASYETRCDEFLGYHYRLKGYGLLKFESTGEEVLRDLNGYLIGYIPTTFELPVPTSSDLYLSVVPDASPGGSEYGTYYGELALDALPDNGIDGEFYTEAYEMSGIFDPWLTLGNIHFGENEPTALFSIANYNPYVTAEDAAPDPWKPPYEFEFRFPTAEQIEGISDDTMRLDGPPIHQYPKRAAIFNCRESWTATWTHSGNVLGSGYTATKVREGHIRADEYLAAPFETNVESFPVLTPVTVDIAEDDRLTEAVSGVMTTPDYLRVDYSARDWHTGKLAWVSDLVRTSTWELHPAKSTPPPGSGFAEFTPESFSHPVNGELFEDTSATTGNLKLLRPDGSSAFGWEDFTAIFPDAFAPGAAPIPVPSTPDSRVETAVPSFSWRAFRDSGSISILDAVSWPYEGTRTFGDDDYEPDEFNHLKRPYLLVGYWNRWPDGGALTPKFPAFESTTPLSASYTTDNPRTSTFIGMPENPIGQEGVRNTNYAIADRIYFDQRTGGFLTQTHWTSKAQGGAVRNAMQTMIGNASGVVPFVDILKEWIALGSGDPPSFTKLLLVGPEPAPSSSAALRIQMVSLI